MTLVTPRGGIASALWDTRAGIWTPHPPRSAPAGEGTWVRAANLDELYALVPAWRALAAHAAEGNVFHAPDFVLSVLESLAEHADLRFLLVWQGSGAAQRLIGFFPLADWRPVPGLPALGRALWQHAYAPLSTPLVDRGHVRAAISAFLDHVMADGNGPRFLMQRFARADGPVHMAMLKEFEARGLALRTYGAHARAALRAGVDGRSYLEQSVPAKRRKELRRQRARLDEQGTLRFELVEDAQELAFAVRDFLILEAKGWKGRRGSAMALDPALAEFCKSALARMVEHGECCVVRLSLDSRPIASAILLQSGGQGWLWKIAYDEAYARYSPGVLLVTELTERMLDADRLYLVDSCAEPNHPLIDRIWRERLEMADVLVALRPLPGTARAVFALEGAIRRARNVAKRLLNRIRVD